MKRICVIWIGLLLLSGCGALKEVTPETTPLAETREHVTNITEATRHVPLNSDGEERFRLCAALPEDDIYLYDINGSNYQGGMVLFHQDRETYFNGFGSKRYNDYPMLRYYDLDGDGEREIVVIGYHGSGTRLWVYSLHVLEVHVDDSRLNRHVTYTEHALTAEDVDAYFQQNMSYKYDKNSHALALTLHGETYLAKLDEEYTFDAEHGMNFASTVGFDLEEDGRITFRANGKVIYEEPTNGPVIVCEFTGDVRYDGSKLELTGISFEGH